MTQKTYKRFTKEEVASWPDEHKKCRGCQAVLPLSCFHNAPDCLLGVANYCKECRKSDSKREWEKTTFEKSILSNAKYRANRDGYPFNLGLEDIVIPTHCPILKHEIELVRGSQYAPSIDKIDPRLGYVKGNIIIVSSRANMLKNNMTYLEARELAEWMEANAKHVDGWTYTRRNGQKDVTVIGRIEFNIEPPSSAFDPSI